LASDMLDAAMVDPMSLLQLGAPAWIIPAGAISSTGPSLFCRLFANARPRDVRTIWAGVGAGSGVALARVLWAMAYHRDLRVIPLTTDEADLPSDAEAVVVVGDRVVASPPLGFDHQTDLAAMWHRRTGLPFVFSVWVATDLNRAKAIGDLLAETAPIDRDKAGEIAERFAPSYGWPTDLALREITSSLDYELTDPQIDSIAEFADLAQAHGIIGSEYNAPISVM